jgi:hypothetical protein
MFVSFTELGARGGAETGRSDGGRGGPEQGAGQAPAAPGEARGKWLLALITCRLPFGQISCWGLEEGGYPLKQHQVSNIFKDKLSTSVVLKSKDAVCNISMKLGSPLCLYYRTLQTLYFECDKE